MQSKTLIICLCLFTLSLNAFSKNHPPRPGYDYIPDCVELKFTPVFNATLQKTPDGIVFYPTGSKELDEIMLRYSCESLLPIFTHDPMSKANPYFTQLGMDRYYLLRSGLPRPRAFDGTDALELAVRMRNIIAIEWADASPVFHGDATPTDWNLVLNGNTANMWGLDSMHCRQAWDYVRGSSQILAVSLDTGVDLFHPDLVNNFLVNSAEDINHNGRFDDSDLNGVDNDGNGFVDDVVGYDFVTMDNYWYPGHQNVDGEDYDTRDGKPMDVHGHGTHVAGTLAAVTNNGVGVPSASYNVKTLCVRVGSANRHNGSGSLAEGLFWNYDVAPGIQYAVNRRARILSLSYGATTSLTFDVIRTAFQYARANNCLPFVSAGNDSVDETHYPAVFTECVAVAALGSDMRRADFSNYGNWVSLCAPGTSILSTMVVNTYHANPYESMQGTSMATPNAASVGALILSKAPWKTDDDLKNFMITWGRDPQQWGNTAFLGSYTDAFYYIRKMMPLMFLTGGLGGAMDIAVGTGIWLSWNRQAPVDSVRLQVNRHFPNGQWETIADNLNDGGYLWTVTPPVGDSVKFRVMSIQDTTICDTSRKLYRILPIDTLPYIQDFSTPGFLSAAGWSAGRGQPDSVHHYTSEHYDSLNGNNGCIRMKYYVEINGGRNYLDAWTPVLFSQYTAAITVQFDLGCAFYTTAHQDTLFLKYSRDNFANVRTAAIRTTLGTGDSSLISGSGGTMNLPPLQWRHCEVQLPADAAGWPTLYIGFSATDIDRRSDIFIDNFRVYGFSRVNSPSNLWLEGVQAHYATMDWQDNSSNESGFVIERSDDSVNFSRIGTTGMNTARFIDTTVIPGTKYWYRVWARNSDILSMNCTNILAVITRPDAPQAPLIRNVGQTELEITVRNSATNENGPNTLYSVYCLDYTHNLGGYIQQDGTWGFTYFGQRLEGWNTFRVHDLQSRSRYQFGVWATVPDAGTSYLSPTVDTTMQGGQLLPVYQNFTDLRFPPMDWETRNPTYPLQWQQNYDSTTGHGAICFPCNSDTGTGGQGYLWTNRINASITPLAQVRFKWCYTPRDTIHNDGLALGWSWDDANFLPLWSADNRGTNGTNLASGFNGSPTLPATWGTWQEARIYLPDNAYASDTIRFVFRGTSSGRGSNIYVSDFTVDSAIAPTAPNNLVCDSIGTTMLRIHWHRTADVGVTYNFVIATSYNGVDFTTVASQPCTDTVYTQTGLSPNAHVWFRVYSELRFVLSETYVGIDRYTLAVPPRVPFIRTIRSTAIGINPQNAISPYNPDSTLYAIQETNSERYVNPQFSNLVLDPVWATIPTWSTVTLYGLVPNHQYRFISFAKNDAEVVTAASRDTAVITCIQATLPFTEYFTSTTFPPQNWSLQTPDSARGWARITGGNAGTGVAHYDCYQDYFLGLRSYLWTPDIDLLAVDSARFSFIWSYSPFMALNDSLMVVAQLQNSTIMPMWLKYARGTGEDSLPSGTGGSALLPAAPGTWRHAVIRIPDDVRNQGVVRFGFVAINRHGGNIYLDSIAVESLTPNPPATPTNLSISYTGATASLNWSAAPGNIAGYKVYRATTAYLIYATANYYALVPPLQTTFSDSNATGYYYYQVTSVNNNSTDSIDRTNQMHPEGTMVSRPARK